MSRVQYAFGVSFNCMVDSQVIGGGDDTTTLDFVGNDLEQLKATMLSRDMLTEKLVLTEHAYIGRSCDIGEGTVVAVLAAAGKSLEPEIVAVFFKDPPTPTVIGNWCEMTIDDYVKSFHDDDVGDFQVSIENDLCELVETGSVTVEPVDASGTTRQAVISLNFEVLEK